MILLLEAYEFWPLPLSYLDLLAIFSPLTLQPLGSGEGVLNISFLKVVGIFSRFPQSLNNRRLVQAQSLDVLSHLVL